MANEKRLIDVNKVIDAMQKCLDESPDKKDSVAYYTFESIIECLKQEPTVDAVEVVRCKDCCHGRQIEKTRSPEKYFKDTCVVCLCESVVGDEPMIYEPTHFCSYGERKDND